MSVRRRHPYLNPLVMVMASLLVATVFCDTPPARGEKPAVPPAIAGLLPKAAVLKSGDWGVFDAEFGTSFTSGMHAGFPGRALSCDSTVGPELRVELKGDTAWEQPPMLEMAVQLHEEAIANARKSLPARLANLKQSNSGITSVGKLTEERLPEGQLLFVEYTESCASRPKGTNTVLVGFARRGATLFSFDLWMSAGAAETKALGVELLENFKKLNIVPLLGK